MRPPLLQMHLPRGLVGDSYEAPVALGVFSPLCDGFAVAEGDGRLRLFDTGEGVHARAATAMPWHCNAFPRLFCRPLSLAQKPQTPFLPFSCSHWAPPEKFCGGGALRGRCGRLGGVRRCQWRRALSRQLHVAGVGHVGRPCAGGCVRGGRRRRRRSALHPSPDAPPVPSSFPPPPKKTRVIPHRHPRDASLGPLGKKRTRLAPRAP